MALKYAPKPVVAAPFGMTLGGGTEMCLHTTRVRAAAETYMGLVEAGVGLIPAGGGTKEMLLRALDGVPADPEADPFTYVKEVFLNIGMAKVSTSAEDARRLRYLSPQDSISMNRDRQIADAKQLALDLVRLGYRPGQPRQDIRALGQAAFTKMKLGLHLMRRAEYVSDYDVVVGNATRQGAFRRRRIHLAATRIGAIFARFGARGFPQPLRAKKDPGAHPVHVEKRQTPEELRTLVIGDCADVSRHLAMNLDKPAHHQSPITNSWQLATDYGHL